MPNILIVCTANICRSPVVEALVKDRLEKKEGGDWHVASAGTWAMDGNDASTYSIELMAEQGLDISNHLSRPITLERLSASDLVLCLASGHVEALKAEFPQFSERIYLLTEMSGTGYSVHDPYGEPRSAYERMVAEVTDLVDRGLPRMMALARQNEKKRLNN
jgi:protein-tyrosine phosphatase